MLRLSFDARTSRGCEIQGRFAYTYALVSMEKNIHPVIQLLMDGLRQQTFALPMDNLSGYLEVVWQLYLPPFGAGVD